MRKRWIWDSRKGELVPAEKYRRPVSPQVMPDISDFTLPGSDIVISGRKAKREYLRRNGLEEVGNDKRGLVEETRRAREYRDALETKQLKDTIADACRDYEFFRGR